MNELLNINDKITLTISSITNGGDGIGRHEGMAVFVPFTATGEVVEVKITEVQKNYARGKVEKITEKSAARIAAPCALYEKCNGCQLMHLDYTEQLNAKRAMVEDALRKMGRFENITVNEVIASGVQFNYRNKCEFKAKITETGKVELGMVDIDGNIINTPDCMLQNKAILSIVKKIEDISVRDFPLAQATVKVNDADDALLILTFWSSIDKQTVKKYAEELASALPMLRGVLYNRVRGKSLARKTFSELVWGEDFLNYKLSNISYRVSAESFFQVNFSSAETLLNTVLDFAGEDLSQDIVFDCYSGVGTFSLPLATRANSLIAIEDSESAVNDANSNLAQYGIDGVKLYNNKTETILSRMSRKGRNADVVVLDPPRKGVGRIGIEELAALDPHRIVMISCDPVTLARDLRDLSEFGYQILKVQPIDMFPQTTHVEAIVLLNKI